MGRGGGGGGQSTGRRFAARLLRGRGGRRPVAVVTVGVGRDGRGRRARDRGRRKSTEGTWRTAVHHFVWLESAGWLVAGSWRVGACSCWARGICSFWTAGVTSGLARASRAGKVTEGDGGNRPRGHGGLPSATLFGWHRWGGWAMARGEHVLFGLCGICSFWAVGVASGRARASPAGKGTVEIDREGMAGRGGGWAVGNQ
jgi:hypothetical protein